jgi:nicotinic acid mononucleotide adenylyltransferase
MNDEINNVPEISSTEIKKMIKNGLDKELEKYLNLDVIKYIKDNNLYES